MKLTVFSSETLPIEEPAAVISVTAKITFSKIGKILISKPAVELIGLTKKDKISLAQADDEAGTWYIFKDEAGFELEETAAGALFFFHPELASTYLGSYDKQPDQGHRAFLCEEAVKLRGKEYWLMDIELEQSAAEE